jgi:hypothetical protein
MSDVCSVRICSWITHYPELGLDFPMVGLKSFYTGQCLGLGARARLRKAVFFSSENTANSLKRRSRKKGAGSLGTTRPPNSFSSAGVARNTGHKVSFETDFAGG